MTDPYQESAQRVTRDLNRALARMFPEPKYRYFQTKDGWMFGWTVEKGFDDNEREGYQSFVYQPKGKGARSGDASKWVLTRAVTHRTRRAAKARALKMFRDRKFTLDGRRILKERA